MDDRKTDLTLMNQETSEDISNGSKNIFRQPEGEHTITDLTNQLSQDFGTSIGLQPSSTMVQNDFANSQFPTETMPLSDINSFTDGTSYNLTESSFLGLGRKNLLTIVGLLCVCTACAVFMLTYNPEDSQISDSSDFGDDETSIFEVEDLETEEIATLDPTTNTSDSADNDLTNSATSGNQQLATLPSQPNQQVGSINFGTSETINGQTSTPSNSGTTIHNNKTYNTTLNKNRQITTNNPAQKQQFAQASRGERNTNVINNIPNSKPNSTTIVNNINVPKGATNEYANTPNSYSMGAKDVYNPATQDDYSYSTNDNVNQSTTYTPSKNVPSNYRTNVNSANEIQAPENPYWALPNQLFGNKNKSVSRTWNTAESTRFRAGIAHKYNYQRYKTVLEIKAKLLKGSDSILQTALEEKKLWIRMNAVMGLADFGNSVPLETVEKALGEEDSELVANFFRRFSTRPTVTEGELYVMRHAIRVVNSRARFQILRTLKRQDTNLADLYLVAGTYDPALVVKRFANTSVKSSKLDQTTLQAYNNVVLGIAEPSSINSNNNYSDTTPSNIVPASDEYNTDYETHLMSQKVQYYEQTSTADDEDAVPASSNIE